MLYRCYHPSTHLKEFIRDYLCIRFKFSANESTPIKPYPACPKQGLIFYIRGTIRASDPLTGKSEKRPQTVIFGQPISRQDLHIPADYAAISVRFQPGALYKFLGVPMTDFIQKNEDAELVLGRQIKLLHEQLSNTDSIQIMLELIEEFLWHRLSRLKDNIHPMDKIGQMIFENPQVFTLDKIAHDACLSPSQLERRFLQQIGVPPKFFARICRFYRAYLYKQRNPGSSWQEVAWDTGYNDYQHMSKDFKAFVNATPNSFIREDARSPEQALSLNPNFLYD